MTGKVRSPEERIGDKVRAALKPVERDVLMQAIDAYGEAMADWIWDGSARHAAMVERKEIVRRMLGYESEATE